MAVTADTVEVRLEAEVNGYLNNLKRAETQGGRSLDRLAQAAIESGSSYKKLAATATTSSQQIIDANQRVAVSAAGANLQVGNIAAQFQDIGVTAAAGMNPLIIALQQGTQLSAILNQSVSQGVSPVKALGAAFSQILNPISLGTIAVIALGTAAIQYFSTLASEGQPSEEILKKQNDRIRDVADRWGEAVPALKAYVDQLDRAADQSSLEVATDDAIAVQFESLRNILPDLRAELAAARTDIAAVGGTAEEIDTLQAAFDAFSTKVQDGTATTSDLDAILKILNGTTGSGTVPTMVNLASVLGNVSAALATAARNAQAFRDDLVNLNAARIRANAQEGFATREFVAEQLRLNSLTADQLALENEVARVKASAERGGATALTDAEALAVATDNLAAAERRRSEAKAASGSGKAGAKAISDAEREAEAVVKLIEELEYEYSVLGLSNTEKAVANALRQAGAAATEEQRAQIESLVTATLSEKEAIDTLNKSSQEWADTIQSATRGFIDDLVAGKSAAEAFSNVLSSVASKLIDVGLDNIFGGGGFNLAGLFGGTSTRAMGGPAYAGNPTLVGEKGPELFIPSTPGKVIPNSQIGGGGSVVFAPNVDARGADVAAVARLEQSLQRLAAEVVPTIRKEIANGPKKGRK